MYGVVAKMDSSMKNRNTKLTTNISLIKCIFKEKIMFCVKK